MGSFSSATVIMFNIRPSSKSWSSEARILCFGDRLHSVTSERPYPRTTKTAVFSRRAIFLSTAVVKLLSSEPGAKAFRKFRIAGAVIAARSAPRESSPMNAFVPMRLLTSAMDEQRLSHLLETGAEFDLIFKA